MSFLSPAMFQALLLYYCHYLSSFSGASSKQIQNLPSERCRPYLLSLLCWLSFELCPSLYFLSHVLDVENNKNRNHISNLRSISLFLKIV